MENPFPKKEQDSDGDSKLVLARTVLTIVLFLSILAAFGYVLYDVQYVHGSEYLDSAFYSVAQTETVDAARGDILDCYGRLLVTNETSYRLTLNPSLADSTENWYTTLNTLLQLCREQGVKWNDSLPVSTYTPYRYALSQASAASASHLRGLTTKLKLDEWKSTVIPGEIDPETGKKLPDTEYWTPTITVNELMEGLIEKYKVEELLPGLTQRETRDLIGILYELDLRRREITYTEYVFTSHVDITFITLVKEAKLIGVSVEPISVRSYETDSAAHILGRVAAVTREQWEGDGKTAGYRDTEGYSYNDRVGQDGIELAFESYLHGVAGNRAIETDSTGKITSEFWLKEPQPGSNVSLTLDINLQSAVEEALSSHIESLEEPSGGAAVMVNMTGGIMAMASYPDFDLSSYSTTFSELSDDPLKPLFNRATQGTYMPGSIFKMVTGLAALEEGVIEPSTRIQTKGVFYGYSSNPDWAPRCWIYRQYGGATHGIQTVSQAITNSCNYFFYEMGYRLGITKLGEYAAMVGLGQPTGIEIPERTGYVAGPETSVKLGTEWYAGATTSAAIGQENNLFTPLQLANYVATLVNGGTHYSAHLLSSVRSADYSQVLYEHRPAVLNEIDIEEENLEALKKGMYEVTQSASVKAYFDALPVKAGAKTGTAQVNNNTSTNATFVCFAPYDDPQVALCLVVENGSSGSSLASLAAEILQFYFSSSESMSSVSGENTLMR